MNRTTVKTLSLLALAAFPFIAGCAGPSERVHQNIQSGVSVKRADVSAALKDGESPWAMHGTDGQIFSLFEYAVKKGELDLLELCLANKSTPELAEAQTSAYVESVVAKISEAYAAEREVTICEKIWNAGLALATKPKLEAKQKQVAEERATRFVESVIAGISVEKDADEDDLARCREYWDKGFALATKPKLEARQRQVEEARATIFVESVIEGISVEEDADEDDLARCREYWDKGLALALKPKLEAKQRQVEEARATIFVESVIEGISVEEDADDRNIARCRDYWDKGLALALKPKFEAKLKQVEEERKRLEEERATNFVESVIEGISVEEDADEDDLARCREYWDKGLALSLKPKLEAKLKQVEEERKRLNEERRKHLCIMTIKSEKQQIFQCLQEEIFPAEQKLSEEERSRGRTLLDAFGEEHMPLLTEKCGEARRKYLEAEANFEELVKALKAENIELKTNPVFQSAGRNWLSLAADYWQLRYTLTDYYSQFKIGVITSDELAAKDEELVALFAEAEKINLTESESK